MSARYHNYTFVSPSICLRLVVALVLALLVPWGAASSAQAQTIYHVTETGEASNDGSSFADSDAISLQGALGQADGNDVIVIAAGRYLPTDDENDRDARFEITGAQDGLRVYGGWAGIESFSDISDIESKLGDRDLGGNPTVLSGDINDEDDTNTDSITEDAEDIVGGNSFTVLYFDGTSGGNITTDTVLDGLVITGGQGENGGGAYCDGSRDSNMCSPVISNFHFRGNTANRSGGGLYNDGDSDSVSSPHIISTTFSGNSALRGGALYNNGGRRGGSIPQIANVVFTNNSSDSQGGAIYNNMSRGLLLISNTTFTANVANSDGGAIYNACSLRGRKCEIEIINSILWNNNAGNRGSEIFNSRDVRSTVSFTLIDGGVNGDGVGGDDNEDGGRIIEEDPLFADSDRPVGPDGAFGTVDDGLRLQRDSPALDAGTNFFIFPSNLDTDLLGEPRLQNGAISLGAYERGVYTGPIYHVDANITGGNNDGSSFDDAFADLQEALDKAEGGDVIVIAEGTYVPSKPLNGDSDERAATFEVTGEQDGLKIYGGWEGNEQFADIDDVQSQLDSRKLSVHETILSGNLNDDENDDSGNAYHVLVLNGGDRIGANITANITEATVLDGVTVTGGRAVDGSLPNNSGGGLYCDGRGNGNICSPSLNRLTFTSNFANFGGAIYNDGRDGGTISLQITNATFTDNTAVFGGGAIYNYNEDSGDTSSPQITNATFTGNIAASGIPEGGAIYNEGARNTLEITNTIVWGNDQVNSLLNDGATLILQNTLVQDATGDGITDQDGGITVILDGDILDTDPQFVDADAGDVRLTAGSPAIARGTMEPFESGGPAEDITSDLAGNDRLFGAKPDLGAFAFSDIATTDNDIADATGLVGYVDPTGFEGLVLLRENSATDGGLTFDRTSEAPADPMGELPDNVAPFTWTVTSGLSEAPSYDLLLSTEDLGGIEDFETLTLYKSDDGQTWNEVTNLGGTLVLDEDRALVAVQDLTGFSQFAIGSSDPSNPLPVELSAFGATLDDDETTLQWETTSETNNAEFEVQRITGSPVETSRRDVSTEKSWETVGTLDGAGTTDEPQSYRFEDAQLPYAADSLSYRLRQIDTDGIASLSETVTIARQVTQAELLPTYPNPVRGHATVRFAVPERQAVRIDLYDMLGRRVQTVIDGEQDGRTEQMLDVSRLSSGTYFLRMQTGSHTETQRVTVVR